MQRIKVFLTLFSIALLWCASAQGQDRKASLEVDVATQKWTGRKIRGPAKITLKNVNVLRYRVDIGVNVQETAGPDLKLPFIPPVSAAEQKENPTTQKETAAAVAVPTSPLDKAFIALANRLNALEGDRVQKVQTPILEAVQAANDATTAIETLATTSDDVLKANGPAALVTSAQATAQQAEGALKNSWPYVEIVNQLTRLATLKSDLQALPVQFSADWAAWYKDEKRTAYDGALARIDQLRGLLEGVARDSQAATNYENARRKILEWTNILKSVAAQSFQQDVNVACGFGFGGSESAVEMVKADRLAAPNTNPTREPVVTVVCAPALSVSAGFGFSSIEEGNFALVPSTKTVTDPTTGKTSTVNISRFGFQSRSNFRPVPLVLLNTRITEWNDTWALHLSAGSAVDIKTGQAQGGTDIEFVVGPTVSFRRVLFVTTGAHVGRIQRLTGGFQIGDEVPAGISAPPIEKAWKLGFAMTFTFRVTK